MKTSTLLRKEIKNKLELDQIVLLIANKLHEAIEGENNYEDKDKNKRVHYIIKDDQTIFNLMLKLGLVKKEVAFHQDIAKNITAHYITTKAKKLYEQLKKEGFYKNKK